MNEQLFESLFSKGPDGFVTLWRLPDRKTFWFSARDWRKAYERALAMSEDFDVYFGVCPRRAELDGGKRGGANDVAAVPALYADIDVASAAHKEKRLPQSREEALFFLNGLEPKPSAIVSSGHGIHAYWLLDAPFQILSDADRANISAIAEGFGRHITERARRRGWRLDTVSDLARVLRVPGTRNHKLGGEARCEVIAFPGERYPLAAFEPYKHKETNEGEGDAACYGAASKLLDKCPFLRHCRDDAATLPEPDWHAMISNLAQTGGGSELIHELSRPYPTYSEAETDEKIRRALEEKKPHTCAYIRDSLGFPCPGDCGVKAPVVHAAVSRVERLRALIDAPELDIGDVFSSETLELLVYAKAERPADYALLKQRLRGKVSLRDLDNAVAKTGATMRAPKGGENAPLCLEGIDLRGAVAPGNWEISLERGVRRDVTTKAGNATVMACASALVITRRTQNIDDGSEKVEIAFFRDHRWKSFVAGRAAAFNRPSVIGFADRGLPVSSESAGEVVKYLAAYESANESTIPVIPSIARLGWTSPTELFPYSVENIAFEGDPAFRQNLDERGDFTLWLDAAREARQNPFGRFLLAVSFASPLLEKLNQRVFFVNIWHDSGCGKTAILKLAVSAWGNPLKLMGSFNATAVGLERMAETLHHIVYAIDERQVAEERRLPLSFVVYSLGQGSGRTRGDKSGGVQELSTWRNIILTSGEAPLLAEDSHDGMAARVLELHGKPTENADFARSLHKISEQNYGHAGRCYAEFLKRSLQNDPGMIQRDYARMHEHLKRTHNDANFLEYVATVCLGDYYAEIALFGGEEEEAFDAVAKNGAIMLQNAGEFALKEDIVDRAWHFVRDWCVANEKAFTDDAKVSYGVKQDEQTFYVLKFALDDALKRQNYPVEKCKTGFFERGYMPTFNGKRQKQKKTNGSLRWYYVVELSGGYADGDIVPLCDHDSER